MPEAALSRAGLRLRPAESGDAAALLAVYASTRQTELAHFGWTDGQQAAFLNFQSSAQEQHYRTVYPELERLVIERAGQLIGRLYRVQTPQYVRVVDLALVPQARGHGWGQLLLRNELDRAATRPVRLSVEKSNPAQRLYARLGFVVIGDEGLYLALERPPQAVGPGGAVAGVS